MEYQNSGPSGTLIAIFNMADDMAYREIQRMEREESRSNWIPTKFALGKFIDQMTWLCIL